MEKYKIDQISNQNILKLGKFYSLIHNKHVKSYKEIGAKNIFFNVKSIYEEIQKQYNDKNRNNNVLLVGKVQSGKTANLELLTALAFDNGYNIVVMYGGYDKSLLSQATDRFKKTFNVPDEIKYDNNYPAVFTTDDSDSLMDVSDEMVSDMLDQGQPIIFISMKRPVAMGKINKILQSLDKSRFKALIIDDEGDQASLNIAKNKETDASRTYAEIVKLKTILNNPVYLSVTATPHANIFLDNISALKPDNIRLIRPGVGYNGVDVYSLNENNLIEIIKDKDVKELEAGIIPKSLWDALDYYIIASAIKRIEKATDESNYSDMIIHSFREVGNHSRLYSCINSKIDTYKEAVNNNDQETLNTMYIKLNKLYNSKLFDANISRKYNFENVFEEIKKVLKRTKIILKNSLGKETQSNLKLKFHKIYIGGDLLQRGLTFDNLITTYFTRWSKDDGNMDTNMQRARWFGYREKYINLCKVFTTSKIAQEFSALGEIEDDLWDQFEDIENGEMDIDNILIQTEKTHQRPTSRSKASFDKVSFKNRWVKQKYILFDKNQITENNKIITDLICKLHFQDTSRGDKQNRKTGRFSKIDNNLLQVLINHIQTVFDMEPFQRTAINELVDGEDVFVILMDSTGNDGTRVRTVYPDTNKIKTLMQGADSKEKDKIVYEGDKFVIIDKNTINIQIHKIMPKVDEKEMKEFTQYMFAIYVPKEKTYYAKR